MSSSSILKPSNFITIVILMSICCINVDNYFGYHAPSTYADEYERDYKLNTEQFGSLFTIYSLPNIILVPFSGVFIDKYGIIATSLACNFLMIFGFIVSAISPYPSANISPLTSYSCLLLGRLFLGLGGESIDTCKENKYKYILSHYQHNILISLLCRCFNNDCALVY